MNGASSKSTFGLLWPWDLTPSRPFHALDPQTICANNQFFHFWNIVFTQPVWLTGSADMICPHLLQPWSLIVRPWNWCKSHLRWGTVLQNLGTLGLCVLELFIMYATNGQMDEQKQRSNRRRPVSWPLTAWMRTLFRGWSIMVNDTHTRRRRLPDAKGWQFHALAYGSLVPICSKTGSFVCKIEFTRLVTYKWIDRQTNQYKTLCTPPAGQSLGC